MAKLHGRGSLDSRLSAKDVRDIVEATLAELPLDGKKVLVLIPDHTRHAPIDLFFHVISDLLTRRVAVLDYLVATGTHAAMEIERIYRHTGLTASEHAQEYPKVRFFNHEHHKLDELVSLGTLKGDELAQLISRDGGDGLCPAEPKRGKAWKPSQGFHIDGLFDRDIAVTINRKATEYDHILIVSPVVPHEAMGFSGGNKYFFPGIAGLDVVEKFHWLAAIITNPAVNGVKDAPTRRVINRTVEFLSTPRTCFAFTIDDHHQMACLYGGSPEETWAKAADFSAQMHIKYLDRPYKRVLGLTPPIYEELWVAGKAMYKLEPIVADGGELVIHGSHVKAVSFMHEKEIARVGYHTRDYFTKQWDRFAHESKLILAHSTNVKGIGRFENGVEYPRVNVTLATSIPERTCKAINLGYRDINSIDIARWKEDPDTLVVEEAGQVLYRLKSAAV